MNNKIKLVLLTAIVSVSLGLATNAVVQTPKKAPAQIQAITPDKSTVTATVYEDVKALDVVANPTKYLNKNIKIKAQFDKFSTLGLDYKPAYRSSEKYISFLIKRDDVLNHLVPLSEMKIFLLRDVAEKYIDLSAGDIVEFSGNVFSNALGDAWIDVKKFTVISQKPKDDKKSTENSTKK